MKNKSLRILSLALAVTTAFSTSTPVFAYEVDEQDNSVESVKYQNTDDEDFSNATNVFAQLGSEYKVTIPKVIVLSGASKDARYYVKVAGDIAGYEKVSVIPENSFKLSAKNKADETATVNQDKTVWTVNDFDTNANGKVEASSITAGSWQGTFNFNINLESDDISTLQEEKVLSDLIIPDVNEWNGQVLSDIYVMEIGDIDSLKVTNNSKDVSDALEITSSNEDVVKVEDKQLEAVGAGQTTITTIYESKSLSAKIKVVELETPTHTHTAGEVVKENEVAATYEKEGSYDEVIYCTDCGEELSRTTKVVPKLLEAGLYDENDNLIKSWDELVELGLDAKIEKMYPALDHEYNASYIFKKNNLSGKLILPNTIKDIGCYAFFGCRGLTSVTIPNSITNINERTFESCSSLTSVVIPDSVTSIGENVFYNCTSLTSVVLPNSITGIEDKVFQGCTSLESIIIPDSVKMIYYDAFYGCTSLKSVTLGNSIATIFNNAFYNCKSLESVTYRGVTYTDKNALNNKLKVDGVAPTWNVWP